MMLLRLVLCFAVAVLISPKADEGSVERQRQDVFWDGAASAVKPVSGPEVLVDPIPEGFEKPAYARACDDVGCFARAMLFYPLNMAGAGVIAAFEIPRGLVTSFWQAGYDAFHGRPQGLLIRPVQGVMNALWNTFHLGLAELNFALDPIYWSLEAPAELRYIAGPLDGHIYTRGGPAGAFASAGIAAITTSQLFMYSQRRIDVKTLKHEHRHAQDYRNSFVADVIAGWLMNDPRIESRAREAEERPGLEHRLDQTEPFGAD